MVSACISAPGNGSIYWENGDELWSDRPSHTSDARRRVEWRLCRQETYRFLTGCKLHSGHGVGKRSEVVPELKPGGVSGDRLRLPSPPSVTLEPERGRSV